MSQKEQLYNRLKETFILLDDGDRRLFSYFNLTPPRYYTLFHIDEDPGMSSRQLSDVMLCDKSNVTRIVRSLESEGFVTREAHETDGRSYRLYLTEEGTAVLQKVRAAHSQYNALRLNSIDTLTEGSLIQNLSELNNSLLDSLEQPMPHVAEHHFQQ